MRQHKLFVPALMGLALTVSSLAARAETTDDMSFSGMAQMDRIDTNKDGMVSKAEYLAMMGKVWDMKAKEMKVTGDKMKSSDFAAIMGFLSRGEKNK